MAFEGVRDVNAVRDMNNPAIRIPLPLSENQHGSLSREKRVFQKVKLIS